MIMAMLYICGIGVPNNRGYCSFVCLDLAWVEV